MKKLKIIIAISLLIIQGVTINAHEGHDHGDKKKQSLVQGRSWFTVNSTSNTFEVVLRYSPIEANEESEMKLFLSDFETNVPIDSAKLTITCMEDKSVDFEVHYLEPGMFELHAVFPEEKAYTLAVNIIAADRADLMLIQNIEVGRKLTQVKEDEASGHALESILHVLLGMIVGALIVLVFKRRKKTVALTILMLLLVPANFMSNVYAHGGEDHGDQKEEMRPSSLATDEVEILKETQFMFSLHTGYTEKTNYYTLLKLYGKIMPSLNGEARIIVPQNGAIVSLDAKIGYNVSKDQVLAVIEQNLTASEVIQIQNEKSNAIAEFESATKDYKRIKALEDVIARKELMTAQIRLENAVRNKRIYDNMSGRMLTITSPIDGVVDNFNLAIGQQVVQGEQLFAIFNTKTLKVEAEIFDKDLHNLNHLDTAGIRPDYTFSVECIQEKDHFSEYARLVSFGKTVNSVNQTSHVILELNNEHELFKPGQFANVEVRTKGKERRIVIPTSALSNINGKPVVFVHSSPEIFTVKYVKPGHSSADRTIILKGLEENERVVVQGSYRVKSIYLNQ